ncbi:PSD1 and planctomycete cytochrome C domain-containing protein [soil metagenome]
MRAPNSEQGWLIASLVATVPAVAFADTPGHWAFQPPVEPAIPEIQDAAWPQTPIDAFILAALEERGLRPADPADPRTLLRRMSYSLTGLPPTIEAVEEYCESATGSPDAAIERLLSSPQFGERWARHWLDLARYSDTKGYAYAPEEFSFVHSWIYRDWVVSAFNDDLPFDQFLVRQLAADRLLALGQCAPDDLAAMGFLTLGPRFIGVEQDIIDDRIDVVTRGMLGLSASCARCHDHKFDPIPTADYYALYAIFDSSSEMMVALGTSEDAELAERIATLDTKFEEQAQEAEQRFLDRAGEYLAAALDISQVPKPDFAQIITKDDLNPEQIRRWHEYLSLADKAGHPVFTAWKVLAELDPSDFSGEIAAQRLSDLQPSDPLVREALLSEPPLLGMEDVARRYGKLFRENADHPALAEVLRGPGSPIAFPRDHLHNVEWLFDESTKTELKGLLAEVERRIIELGEAAPHAVVMDDNPVPQNTRVLLRGDYSTQGEEVPRRAPTVLGAATFDDGSGRLELARAIADANNPLTARVIVNRIWHHHFGTGLVSTPSDFGLRSEPPSHPGLLDYLARRLIENNWSLKSIHRLIVQSAVYQQASSPSPQALLADPENRLLSHFPRRRLDFESMRDSLLAASGELDLSIGGQPVALLGAGASPRRSLYGRIDRQFVPSTLRDFDFANPELHSPQRHQTNVPQQALFFMNSPFVEARALAFAQRVDGASPAARISQFFRLALQRDPTSSEMANSQEFIAAALSADSLGRSEEPAIEKTQTQWIYGYGEFDESTGSVANFEPLPHFDGDAWGGGPDWPDAELGWLRLTATGGHVGNDLRHGAVRRWISPVAGMIRIAGSISVTDGCGDGVRAVAISDLRGVLGSWIVEFGEPVQAVLDGVEVTEGEHIDFLVDCRPDGNIQCDYFMWAPTISHSTEAEWDAESEFGGEVTRPAHQLDAWERFAHALLLSNAFMFVD